MITALKQNRTGAFALLVSGVTLALLLLGLGKDIFHAGSAAITRSEVEAMITTSEERVRERDREERTDIKQRLIRIENLLLDRPYWVDPRRP